MKTDLIHRCWDADDWREAFDELTAHHARFLVFHRDRHSVRVMPPEATAVSLEFHPGIPLRSPAIQSVLGPQLSLLARSPDQDEAAWVPASLCHQHRGRTNAVGSPAELIMALAETCPLVFVPADAATAPSSTHGVPDLTMPQPVKQPAWRRDRISAWEHHDSSRMSAKAIAAGLYLMNDFFDESHSCSQSLEGIGDRTGDYWHAILHRREPDYGNARYWFRHVGRHPVMNTLARHLASVLDRRALPERARTFASSAMWDPIAFVGLCEAAEHDPALRAWCAGVQYLEMQFLLEHSVRELGA